MEDFFLGNDLDKRGDGENDSALFLPLFLLPGPRKALYGSPPHSQCPKLVASSFFIAKEAPLRSPISKLISVCCYPQIVDRTKYWFTFQNRCQKVCLVLYQALHQVCPL